MQKTPDASEGHSDTLLYAWATGSDPSGNEFHGAPCRDRHRTTPHEASLSSSCNGRKRRKGEINPENGLLNNE